MQALNISITVWLSSFSGVVCTIQIS